MAKLTINTGQSDNDKTGDTLRTAFTKVNANFTELYAGAAAEDRLTKGVHQLVLDVNVTTPYVTFPADSGGNITIQGSGIIASGNGVASRTVLGSAESDVRLVANFAGTPKTWQFGTNGTLTFPDATTQTTAYVAPTTGNSTIISDPEGTTVSRNGMTIRVTSAGMIQMSFNSAINVKGRSSINNADSVVIASPNGVTTASTWYNIGAVLASGDHLTATIVDESYHHIYRLTAIIIQKTTTPGQEIVVSYAIIEQIQ
jgi:hypothetical protein